MRWLAIETSSDMVSLAAGEQSRCAIEISQKGSASRLVDSFYRGLRLDLKNIDAGVISQGPGSYNGLRVGYAFLKGLLVFDQIPVIQIPTPLIMAAQAADQLGLKDGNFLILNNARRGEIYGALVSVHDGVFQKIEEYVGVGERLQEKFDGRFDGVASWDYASSDLPDFKACRWLFLYPYASIAGRIACSQNLATAQNLLEIEPAYVREPVPK